MATRKAPTAQLIGEDAAGKPRLRVQAGFDYSMYRNLSLPGQVQTIFPLTSGKSEAQYRDTAVRAVRDLDRNNEIIRGGLDRKTNTIVGANLRVNPMPAWRVLGQSPEWAMEFSSQMAAAWQDWAADDRCLCDSEGHYQFGGLMWQAFRTLAGPDAEVCGVIHYEEERRERYQTKWATHVQLIDPDRLGNPDGRSDSATLFRGRELDEHGRMIGLHIRRTHPNEPSANARDHQYSYVERETEWGRPMAFHWFFKRRAGMQRAISNLVTSLRHIKMLDKFDDATLQNAVVNGILATFIQSKMRPEEMAAHLAPAGEEEEYSGFEQKLEHYEEMDLKIGDQRIPVLGPNDEIVMKRMADAIPGAGEFRSSFHRGFASALGMPAEQLSLDYTQANYSSIRASGIDAWRNVMTERHFFVKHVATLAYTAVMEEAFAIGELETPRGAPDFYEARQAYLACSWTGPGMGWVDPLKEAKAARERTDGRFSTLEQENAAQGNNWRDTLDQLAVEQSYAASVGVDMAPVNAPAAGPPQNEPAEDEAEEEEETE